MNRYIARTYLCLYTSFNIRQLTHVYTAFAQQLARSGQQTINRYIDNLCPDCQYVASQHSNAPHDKCLVLQTIYHCYIICQHYHSLFYDASLTWSANVPIMIDIFVNGQQLETGISMLLWIVQMGSLNTRLTIV